MIPLFLSLVDNWEYKASLKLTLQFPAEYHFLHFPLQSHLEMKWSGHTYSLHPEKYHIPVWIAYDKLSNKFPNPYNRPLHEPSPHRSLYNLRIKYISRIFTTYNMLHTEPIGQANNRS